MGCGKCALVHVPSGSSARLLTTHSTSEGNDITAGGEQAKSSASKSVNKRGRD
ncbi:hypothetical protein HMPREF9241_01233 [Schaalia turicensis ACS-279-V-Col4]|uniref:Uncharacterized protein n=1 Tax=Schaalia turicensis ACS-279-V-Col4 TaxID=883077 RepID=K0Z0U6_9ACTO|nr:hypothetical protein HMPREF9241_01233 [Schaalia turicensis ACS-279-V-Col4]